MPKRQLKNDFAFSSKAIGESFWQEVHQLVRKPTNVPPGGGVVTDRMMRDVVIVRVHWSTWASCPPRRGLEAAPVVPGTMATWGKLTDPERRPPVAREELCQEVVDAVPERAFQLDSKEFLVCCGKQGEGQLLFLRT